MSLIDYFRNKTAIVTGGANGLGFSLAQKLSELDCCTLILDKDKSACESINVIHMKKNKRLRAREVNVVDSNDVSKSIREFYDEQGKIDILINNAGIAHIDEVLDLELKIWKNIIDVNLWGVINCTTHVYPIMVEQGFGQIINISSLSGLLTDPGSTAYATAKAAVINLSLSMRAEAKFYNVGVSTVCPGYLSTDIYVRTLSSKVDTPRFFEALHKYSKPFSVEKASILILKAIKKNKAMLVLPASAKWELFLSRIIPGFMNKQDNELMNLIRKYKRK